MVEHIFQKRLPVINDLLSKDRSPIATKSTLAECSVLVKSIVYHECCKHLNIPCLKEDRCLWLQLRWNASASSVEQVFRTALKTKGVVVDFDQNTGIEQIHWVLIETTNRNRVDRRLLIDSDFDNQIASQNYCCWGYDNKAGLHIPCTVRVQRGNGNTEQGHQPGLSQDGIVAQCRSCNRKQTIGDRHRGVYD